MADKEDTAQVFEIMQALNGASTARGYRRLLTTVEGGKLTAMMQGGKLVLTDEKGGTSTVTIADVIQSNGVIHVVDTVLMPN